MISFLDASYLHGTEIDNLPALSNNYGYAGDVRHSTKGSSSTHFTHDTLSGSSSLYLINDPKLLGYSSIPLVDIKKEQEDAVYTVHLNPYQSKAQNEQISFDHSYSQLGKQNSLSNSHELTPLQGKQNSMTNIYSPTTGQSIKFISSRCQSNVKKKTINNGTFSDDEYLPDEDEFDNENDDESDDPNEEVSDKEKEDDDVLLCPFGSEIHIPDTHKSMLQLLKDDVKMTLNEKQFIINPNSYIIQILELYPSGMNKVSLTINEHFTAHLHIHGHEIKSNHKFWQGLSSVLSKESIQSAANVNRILLELNNYSVCAGNFEAAWLQQIDSNITAHRGDTIGYRDNLVPEKCDYKFSSTIRHTDCDVITERGSRCSSCKNLRSVITNRSKRGKGNLNRIKCNNCTLEFCTQERLETHMATHKEQTCKICELKFPSQYALTQHKARQHPRPSKCSVKCDTQLINTESLNDYRENKDDKEKVEMDKDETHEMVQMNSSIQLQKSVGNSENQTTIPVGSIEHTVDGNRTSENQTTIPVGSIEYTVDGNRTSENQTKMPDERSSMGEYRNTANVQLFKCVICPIACFSQVDLGYHMYSHSQPNSTLYHEQISHQPDQGQVKDVGIYGQETLQMRIEASAAGNLGKTTIDFLPSSKIAEPLSANKLNSSANLIDSSSSANKQDPSANLIDLKSISGRSVSTQEQVSKTVNPDIPLSSHLIPQTKVILTLKPRSTATDKSNQKTIKRKLKLKLKERNDRIKKDTYDRRIYMYNRKCAVCLETFPSKSELMMHSKTHTGDEKRTCLLCDLTFGNKHLYTIHSKTHRKNLPTCDICGQTFTCRESLRSHTNNKHNSNRNKYPCEKCGKLLSSRSGYGVHMKEVHGERSFLCDVCGKSYQRASTLAQHRQVVHEPNKTYYPCTLCSSKFTYKLNLRKHMLKHNTSPKYKCHICSFKCYHFHKLRDHLAVHAKRGANYQGRNFEMGMTMRRTFLKCKQCDHEEDITKNMTEYRSNGTQTVPCHKCGTECSLKTDLGKQCSICEKICLGNTVGYHERFHQSSRPYACDVCGKTFRYKHCLTGHSYIHTDRSKLQCKECGSVLSSISNLHHHQRRVHPTKKVKCELCSKEFNNYEYLDRHYKCVHLGQERRGDVKRRLKRKGIILGDTTLLSVEDLKQKLQEIDKDTNGNSEPVLPECDSFESKITECDSSMQEQQTISNATAHGTYHDDSAFQELQAICNSSEVEHELLEDRQEDKQYDPSSDVNVSVKLESSPMDVECLDSKQVQLPPCINELIEQIKTVHPK